MATPSPLDPDRHETAALYAAHHGRAFAIAMHRLGDRAMAEDAVSEVFVKALQRRNREPIREPEHYISRAVSNETASQVRKVVSQREKHSVMAAAASPSSWTVAQATFERVADRDVLVRALRQLPARQRTAVLLRHLADLSEQETARRMNVTVGTVKSSTAKGLARLRTLLSASPTAAPAERTRHKVGERPVAQAC
jgi:RNA polymerase sigma factor (sigma-70 family)